MKNLIGKHGISNHGALVLSLLVQKTHGDYTIDEMILALEHLKELENRMDDEQSLESLIDRVFNEIQLEKQIQSELKSK